MCRDDDSSCVTVRRVAGAAIHVIESLLRILDGVFPVGVPAESKLI